jgi:predicted ArsR family transcriptional regulator
MSGPNDFEQQVSGIAALDEPVRRALYLHVVKQEGDVTRDAAAAALGITRALAAFHLDKLVKEGMLDARFRRLSGRVGPGAGRPSKLYRRSARVFQVALPARQYEIAAQLMARAIDATDSPEIRQGLRSAAHDFGRTAGEGARGDPSDQARGTEGMDLIESVLLLYGYEPQHESPHEIRLRNCPFHVLARDHASLVCGLNLDLMQGLLDGMEDHSIEAVLQPRPGMCCVAFQQTQSA